VAILGAWRRGSPSDGRVMDIVQIIGVVMVLVSTIGLMALGCYRVTEPNQGYTGRHVVSGGCRRSPVARGHGTGAHRAIGA
jgi:hypothetical protein